MINGAERKAAKIAALQSTNQQVQALKEARIQKRAESKVKALAHLEKMKAAKAARAPPPEPVQETEPEPEPEQTMDPVTAVTVEEIAPVPDIAVVEVEESAAVTAEESVPADAGAIEEPTPVDVVAVDEPAPADTLAVEEAVPADTVALEEPAPAETVAVEEPTPAEEEPAPADTVAVEEPAPADTVAVEEPAPVDTVAVEELAPVDTVAIEEPAPVDTVAVEESAPADTVAVKEPVLAAAIGVQELAAAPTGANIVTPKLIKELRDQTSAGMMDCKKALLETDGDMEAAAEYLRKKGLAKADKKASRVAAEGKIALASDSNGRAVMVEVNCETDFVGKDSTFLDFSDKVALAALNVKDDLVESLMGQEVDGESLESIRQALVAKIGENIQVRRMASRGGNGNTVVGGYVHMNSIGVLVELEGGDEQLCTDIAMHVTAMNPPYATADDVPAEVLQKEREILSAQALESGKPPEIVEKMVC
jgi:elongation factor Ts